MLSNPARLHFCKLADKKIKPNLHQVVLLVLLVVLCMVYFSGIANVPYHPDESTQLTMSGEFEALINNPSSLAWNPNQGNNPSQTYRLLDAPLTRYLLGISRYLADLPAPSSYWNWSLNWQANLQKGAIPDPRTLLIGRIAISLLFPISLVFLHISTRAIGGNIGGYTAIFLLGMNALVLLHTRRAMAEGTLLFAITAVMASWLIAPKRAWLVVWLWRCFNAKQSSIVCCQLDCGSKLVTDGSQHRPVQLAGISSISANLCYHYMALRSIAWQHPLKLPGLRLTISGFTLTTDY
jgi:hypothetical protein